MNGIKAVSLLSGGLDSILATRLIMEQGVDVVALSFSSPFFGRETLQEREEFLNSMMEENEIRAEFIDISREYMEMLGSPKHGYGSNFNPCIDCKILMVSKGLEYIKESGAKFIVSGEVLGQRPMSQRRDTMRVIERESGAEGILLRPLSAKLLDPTIPEMEGWVDRDALFDFSGRTRRPQMSMAERMGITNYPSPAGGCCLTDPIISERIRKLYQLKGKPHPEDISPLRLGRPFYLGNGTILTVGRDREENEKIEEIVRPKDLFIMLESIPGPLGLLRGASTNSEIDLAMSIVARYSKVRNEAETDVSAMDHNNDVIMTRRVVPADDGDIRRYEF